MFEQGSRYASVPTLTYTDAQGKSVRYKAQQFCPQGQSLRQFATVTVAEGDRLDLIAARMLGNPQQYWWICDANDAINPPGLVALPGRQLRIPIPQAS